MRKEILKNNERRVTVRVWLANRKSGCVSHASLETYGENHLYASVWPKTAVDPKNNSKAPLVYRTRHQDYDIKGDPDAIFNLYTLDVVTIRIAFLEFKQSGREWDLWGSSVLAKENTQNCSGLVLELLKRGGISSLAYVDGGELNARTYSHLAGASISGAGGVALSLALLPATGGLSLVAALGVTTLCTVAGGLSAEKVCDKVDLPSTPHLWARPLPLPDGLLIFTKSHLFIL